MSSRIMTVCPSCGESNQVSGDFIGTRAHCKKCGCRFMFREVLKADLETTGSSGSLREAVRAAIREATDAADKQGSVQEDGGFQAASAAGCAPSCDRCGRSLQIIDPGVEPWCTWCEDFASSARRQQSEESGWVCHGAAPAAVEEQNVDKLLEDLSEHLTPAETHYYDSVRQLPVFCDIVRRLGELRERRAVEPFVAALNGDLNHILDSRGRRLARQAMIEAMGQLGAATATTPLLDLLDADLSAPNPWSADLVEPIAKALLEIVSTSAGEIPEDALRRMTNVPDRKAGFFTGIRILVSVGLVDDNGNEMDYYKEEHKERHVEFLTVRRRAEQELERRWGLAFPRIAKALRAQSDAQVVCCTCGQKYEAKEELVGKRVKCGRCQRSFVLTLPNIVRAKDDPCQIELPDGWTAAETGDELSMHVINLAADIDLAVLVEEKSKFVPHFTCFEYSALVRSIICKSWQNVSTSKPTFSMVGGWPAVRYNISYNRPGSDLKLATSHVAIGARRRFYQLALTQKLDDLEKNRPDVEAILANFKGPP